MQIEAPDAAWPEEFAKLRGVILGVAPVGSVIHHIGSTAVPNLPAKNIIDIQLTVTDLSAVDRAAIEAAGFTERPGLVDHCPPGLTLDQAELRKLFFRSNGRGANLHVREAGRFNQRFPLLCRDFLRAHPTAAGAYGLIKQRLALRFPGDEVAYYEIKDPVFDIIVAGANDWAALVSWTPPASD